MTGEEFLFLSRHASVQAEAQPQPTTDTERKYVYGILGIAKLFGCSLPTANRIHDNLASNLGNGFVYLSAFLDIQRYNRTIHIYHPHTYHSKPYLILHRSRTEITASAQG